MNKAKYPFLDLGLVNAVYADRIKEAVCRVIDSGRYIGGEENSTFERKMSELTEADCIVGTSNGLDALRLSIMALIISGRLHRGDKVMVAANTYIASILAITDAGLTPQLVDPDDDSMLLTGDIVRQNITADTKAIMPVHLYGRVAWDESMGLIAQERNLIVIEDAAQSIGAKAHVKGLFRSSRAGALGHIGAFSFYPTKNIGALGDAGAIATHDPELADICRALANYGSDRRYHNFYRGYNCRLDPMQAAILSVKLDYCANETQERFARAVAYENTISNPLIRKPSISRMPTDSVWHQYVIRCPRRDELQEFLARHGVQTDIHYAVPPHMQPCYSTLPHRPLPITEQIASEVLSLPITPACTSVKDASDIGRIINQFK